MSVDGGLIMNKKEEILKCINRIANAMGEIDKCKDALRELIGTDASLVQMLGKRDRTVYVRNGIDTIADACGCVAKIEDSGSCIERKTFTYRGICFNQHPKFERKEYD